MYWLGIDIGGTFTDLVLYDDVAGTTTVAKTPSIPDDAARAVLNGVRHLGIQLAQTSRVVHGTTVATNTIIEGKGAQVGVVTTKGHGDALEIGRGNRPVLYDVRTLKFEPLVARDLRVEVDERTLFDRTVMRPITTELMAPAVERLRTAGVEAVAVCFLHSYANPENERRAADLLRATLPDVFVTTSAEVVSEYREFERFSTAVLNAYVAPRLDRYLGSLAASLAESGYRRSLAVMSSSGGIVGADTARRLPVQLVLSGPAGGVSAAVYSAKLSGYRDVITYDMGGTSTDVCLVQDAQPSMSAEGVIAEHPNKTLQIDINSIGAGGGSIAWIDRGDILQVGPRSSGSSPGPAAYDRGGVEPTVSDANLVLGRIADGAVLGGEIRLRADLARAAVHRIAARIPQLDDFQTAEGIIRIAVAKMVSAIKSVSIARGHDPRDFALLAYGGAGPMHAALIAGELEMPRVIVPPSPGNFSAYGLLVSDLRHDYVRTHVIRTREAATAELEAYFAEMAAEGRAQLAADGVAVVETPSVTFGDVGTASGGAIRYARSLGMRYVGQSFDLSVPLPAGPIPAPDDLQRAFYAAHERRYGHALESETEIVSLRLSAFGALAKPDHGRSRAQADGADVLCAALVTTRSVYFDGRFRDTPVYDRDQLPEGTTIPGPAIVDEPGATTVVTPDYTARVDHIGNLVLERLQFPSSPATTNGE